ncbi:hypothetical protein ACIGHN_10900 [Acidovorax sp. NPDC077693]|uniref:hypothetical protein n=1 Tax=unclassified Acidovorax TaxID=2684926 RepID=UPI0037C6F85E
MIKKLLAITSIALAPLVASAGAENGVLAHPGGGLDFQYPSTFAKARASIQNGGQIKLQSRFVWGGPAGSPIGGDEHAIVAFTQGANNSYVNGFLQPLWTHGVGAFVHPNGLHLELWFRNDDNGNGTIADDVTKADVWGQYPNNCRTEINGVGNTNVDCLGGTPHSGGYMTPSAFSLKKGAIYWVRITVADIPTNPLFASLQADLLEETPSGVVLRQQGLVNFDKGRHFPDYSSPLKGTIARTGGSGEVIQFNAFDYGF